MGTKLRNFSIGFQTPYFCYMANSLSVDQALPKIRHYCSYQERCHQEVKEKLYGYGLRKNDVELVISQLIEEDYLNEERFARHFAGGKFRMKNWGRIRIQNELKLKQVSDYCIRKAMKEIADDDYQSALEKLAAGRWETLKTEVVFLSRLKKTQDYLLYKGYEWELVQRQLQLLKINTKNEQPEYYDRSDHSPLGRKGKEPRDARDQDP